ncbi:hypothetical protein TL16_g07045 [Triparma laevis f. inornata]|uniref:Uncharacterized protein n=1 Tax=Triparma laevis f. inornata TaxID=1714386 RepID=A0A9W7ANQ9_9STRA|nr:hypothetical protein TL16_g07045 [Triparma laevis f. inornata]
MGKKRNNTPKTTKKSDPPQTPPPSGKQPSGIPPTQSSVAPLPGLVEDNLFFLIIYASAVRMFTKHSTKDITSPAFFEESRKETSDALIKIVVLAAITLIVLGSKLRKRLGYYNKHVQAGFGRTLMSYISYIPLLAVLFSFVFVFGLTLFSNHEAVQTSRTVFKTNMLDIKECKEIIKMASRAKMNWTTDRHPAVPTVDMNVEEAFQDKDKAKLTKIFDERLSPFIEKTLGITRNSVRADDMFIVKYSAIEKGGYDLSPPVGNAFLHRSRILHEGIPISKGERYILVLFMHIDQFDFETKQSYGLHPFSTWLNIGYMESWFNERYQGLKTELIDVQGQSLSHKYLRTIFYTLMYSTRLFSDFVGTVTPGGKFIEILDSDKTGEQGANWLHGQHMRLNEFGERVRADQTCDAEGAKLTNRGAEDIFK